MPSACWQCIDNLVDCNSNMPKACPYIIIPLNCYFMPYLARISSTWGTMDFAQSV